MISDRGPMTKDFRELIADQVLNWFDDVLTYLDKANWQFKVGADGKYLPPDIEAEPPADFTFVEGRWSLTLWVLHPHERIPHTRHELTARREAVHRGVTSILMNLIGSAQAGKRLTEPRARYDLPKLRKVDIWGKQKLLW